MNIGGRGGRTKALRPHDPALCILGRGTLSWSWPRHQVSVVALPDLVYLLQEHHFDFRVQELAALDVFCSRGGTRGRLSILKSLIFIEKHLRMSTFCTQNLYL